MTQKKMQDFLTKKFSFLEKELGLSKLIVKNKDWNTDIYYLGNQIGFQFELDWRDFDVFVLVVLLEDGKIPGGYYMNQGKRCRIHLEKALKECLQIQDEILNIMIGNKNKNGQFKEEAIKERITIYGNVLKRYVEKLINAGEAIFEA
jgi:hypothetical protein